MTRTVRVLPDVPAIDRVFDYLVPDELGDQVRVGTIVRVPLHGRRVRGWVVEEDTVAPDGVDLRAIAKVTGWGPPPELIELASWAAWRWAGRTATLLRTSSPPAAVRGLPAAPARAQLGGKADARAAEALRGGGASLLRLPPAADRLPVALAAAALGPALVLCPTLPMANAAASGLRRAGVPVALHPDGWAAGAAGATVVGTRSAVWAPVAGLAAIVVFDEHDESLQQEQAPTWHARDVALERARRADVPCLLSSACPSLEALKSARLVTVPRGEERAGWPQVVVADRRDEDPATRGSPVSPALRRVLEEGGRVLCVLNRTGRARLLACITCASLARCEQCDAAVEQPSEAVLRCRRCGTERPLVCLSCSATRFKTVRAGVSRVRDDLEALLKEPVAEVTARRDPLAAATRVVVGTEAVLHQTGRADVVAFLDFDQELLAPRYRAAEQAFALLARAARVVAAGQPSRGGRAHGQLLVQTRVPHDDVVQAALHADPTRVSEAEAARRKLLGFPPETAMAAISGAAASDFVEAFGTPPGVDTLGPSDGMWLLRAADHDTLCDALTSTPRPQGRVRVEVDPLRI